MKKARWRSRRLGLLVLGSLFASGAASAQVGGQQKISAIQGNFTGELGDAAAFGEAVAALGDLDRDGVEDVAVSSPGTLTAYPEQAVWILFLNPDGTVREHQRIAPGVGGFVGPAGDDKGFGHALAVPGDLDGDGVVDLAVGDLNGGPFREGAVWILFLETDGTVRAETRIDATDLPEADLADWFGGALAAAGDLDGDGVKDLLAGAPFDDDGGTNRGAFYILFLQADGSLRDHRKISQASFGGALVDWDRLGTSVALIDDLDGDGVRELAAGAPGPLSSQPNVGAGAVWILFPNQDGTIRSWQEIGAGGVGGFTGTLQDNDKFGEALALIDDLDGDDRRELVVGARQEKSGGAVGVGAIWVLFLDEDGVVKDHRHIGNELGGLPDVLPPGANFGSAVAALGDLNRDGFRDLFVGSRGDRDGSSVPFVLVGAAWVLFLDEGLAPLATSYGCGVNPPGSLVLSAGEPRVGETFRLALDNPLGTQQPGALAYLWLSKQPHPLAPCGLALPGYGMAAPGAVGELLIDPDGLCVLGVDVLSRSGAPWGGSGQPVDFTLRIPGDVTLLGLRVYAQGLLIDLSRPEEPHLGLSQALELRVGAPGSTMGVPVQQPSGGSQGEGCRNSVDA